MTQKFSKSLFINFPKLKNIKKKVRPCRFSISYPDRVMSQYTVYNIVCFIANKSFPVQSIGSCRFLSSGRSSCYFPGPLYATPHPTDRLDSITTILYYIFQYLRICINVIHIYEYMSGTCIRMFILYIHCTRTNQLCRVYVCTRLSDRK